MEQIHKIVHNLRQRPEEHRRHILHVTTVVMAALLVFLWVFSLGRTLTSEDLQKKVEKDTKPLSALKANLVDGYKNLYNPSLPDFNPSNQNGDVQ